MLGGGGWKTDFKSQSQLGAGGGRESSRLREGAGVLFPSCLRPPDCVTLGQVLDLLWAFSFPSVEWGWWARWCGGCLIWIMWAGPSDGEELCVGVLERDKCLSVGLGVTLEACPSLQDAGAAPLLCLVVLVGLARACPEPCECGEKYGFHIADCAYRDLKAVPSGFPANVTTPEPIANQLSGPAGGEGSARLQSLWLAQTMRSAAWQRRGCPGISGANSRA